MKLGYLLAIIAVLGFSVFACGGKKEETTTQGNIETKPADTTVTMDSIQPSEINNIQDIMSDMAKNYNSMSQKIEAKNYKAASEAWQRVVSGAKALGKFKPESNGQEYIMHQQDLLKALDETGKLIGNQSPQLSEKNAAISLECEACHNVFRK